MWLVHQNFVSNCLVILTILILVAITECLFEPTKQVNRSYLASSTKPFLRVYKSQLHWWGLEWFFAVAKTQIAFCIPNKVLSVGARDPSFTTPVIKVFKWTVIASDGKEGFSNSTYWRIGSTLIAESRSSRCIESAHANSKDLWQAAERKRW